MLANCSRRGHGREDLAESVNQPAFLIHTQQRWRWQQPTNTIQQRAQLFGTRNVTSEDNDTAGLHFGDQVACRIVELRTGKTDEEELSDLLFEWERVE